MEAVIAAPRSTLLPREPVTLRGHWRTVAQAAFFVFAVAALVQTVVANHAIDRSYLTEDMQAWPRHDRVVAGLDELGIPRDALGWWELGWGWASSLVALGLALLIVLRRPGQVMGLVVATFILGSATATYPPEIGDMAEEGQYGRAFLASVTTFPFPAGLLLLPFIFPDGRFVPRWTVIPIGLLLAWLAYDFFPYARGSAIGSGWFDAVLLLAVLSLALGSQVYRYRFVSDPETRQRTRLFAIGIAVNLAAFVAVNVALDLGNFDRPDLPPVQAVVISFLMSTLLWLAGLAFVVILAVAILREQLFGIQVVLNRTLAHAGLTAVVVAAYLAVTAGMVHLIGARTGLAGAVGVAVAMLAVYPVGGRLQRAVDRIVYGQRKDPWAVLSSLSRRFEGAVPAGQILDEIATSVTQALKLPYAAVFIGDSSEPAAESGTPTVIAQRIALVHQDQHLGWLAVAAWPGTPLRPRDIRLLEDLAHQAGAAVHAVRLTVELQQSRERIVIAREEERRRLRRDLHDGLGPRLAGMMMRIEAAQGVLPDERRAAATLASLSNEMADAIADIRRVVDGLRPPALDELGLVAALRQTADAFESARLDVVVEAPDELPPLPAAVEVAAYRIAQEAITNAARHSGGSRCVVRFAVEARQIRLTITDDGRGIGEGAVGGVGLRSMQERAEEIGGSIEVGPALRGGTLVSAILPFPAGPEVTPP